MKINFDFYLDSTKNSIKKSNMLKFRKQGKIKFLFRFIVDKETQANIVAEVGMLSQRLR